MDLKLTAEHLLVGGSCDDTVVTEEDFIVVNGVLASPFAVNHAVPNAFYHIHRTLFWMAPALVKSAVFAEAHRVFSALFMNASM